MVSNPTGGVDVCCVCCVLSGRGLCDELITRPEESYWLLHVVVCDHETSWYEEAIARAGLQNQRNNNNRCYTWRQIHILIISHSILIRWEMFQTKAIEKIKTHILRSKPCFLKSCRLGDNVEKYRGAGQGTEDNTAHAHCVPNNANSEYVICISFHRTSAHQCHVIRTLPVLFDFRTRRCVMSFENSTENCCYYFTLNAG
jgi:hypothetical protein